MTGISWDGTEGSLELPSVDSEGEQEEKLAFALADGRVGVLSVKGRKVYPRPPLFLFGWQPRGLAFRERLQGVPPPPPLANGAVSASFLTFMAQVILDCVH